MEAASLRQQLSSLAHIADSPRRRQSLSQLCDGAPQVSCCSEALCTALQRRLPVFWTTCVSVCQQGLECSCCSSIVALAQQVLSLP